jgi:hypothetical protein
VRQAGSYSLSWLSRGLTRQEILGVRVPQSIHEFKDATRGENNLFSEFFYAFTEIHHFFTSLNRALSYYYKGHMPNPDTGLYGFKFVLTGPALVRGGAGMKPMGAAVTARLVLGPE